MLAFQRLWGLIFLTKAFLVMHNACWKNLIINFSYYEIKTYTIVNYRDLSYNNRRNYVFTLEYLNWRFKQSNPTLTRSKLIEQVPENKLLEGHQSIKRNLMHCMIKVIYLGLQNLKFDYIFLKKFITRLMILMLHYYHC